ncbi:MAG: hypothetical protein EGP63_12905 [Bacteroides stercoris]|jgi:hypothetical protein|nr:hypothetical protein [Bacteroides stercoris]
MINIALVVGVNTCIVILVITQKWKFNISILIMKRRIEKKMQKYQHRYKLHQYLKYARQWCFALAYKGKLYTLLDDGRIVKENSWL